MILVASTCAPWKCDGDELWWLTNAEAMIDDAASVGHDVEFFAALEVDRRAERYGPYMPMFRRLVDLPCSVWHWWFSLDDGHDIVDGDGRLTRICAGRNVISEYASRRREISHVLFLDTDVEPPADALSKLLEVEWPIIGGEVPTYCLNGTTVCRSPYPVEQRDFNTAGFLLVERKIFRRLRWRWDRDAGMTDDPCYGSDARDLGFRTWVRTDVIGKHHPESIGPFEQRAADRSYVR